MKVEFSQHHEELKRNIEYVKNKPILKKIYKDFYKLLAKHLAEGIDGAILEVGSGVLNIKKVIPKCIRSDLFSNPGIDCVGNVYHLPFPKDSLSNIILFDVFHHLEFPGTALAEFSRGLSPGGRVLIFEPCVSLLGLIVYGLFHHEPLSITKPIQWFSPSERLPENYCYYASQGNAWRIFLTGKYRHHLSEWKLIKKQRISAISYVTSGGYSKPQLYPENALPLMKIIDKICDCMPYLFATRLLVVLEKKYADEK